MCIMPLQEIKCIGKMATPLMHLKRNLWKYAQPKVQLKKTSTSILIAVKHVSELSHDRYSYAQKTLVCLAVWEFMNSFQWGLKWNYKC